MEHADSSAARGRLSGHMNHLAVWTAPTKGGPTGLVSMLLAQHFVGVRVCEASESVLIIYIIIEAPMSEAVSC